MMFLELFCDVFNNEPEARLRLGSVAAALVNSLQQSVNSTLGETCLLLLIVCSCLFILMFYWLCFPCEHNVRDCLYRETDAGGGLCHGHISHLVHPKTLIEDRLEHAKKWPENLANLFRRASDSQFFFAGVSFFRRWQVPLVATRSNWQTSKLAKLTCQVNFTNHHISTRVGLWLKWFLSIWRGYWLYFEKVLHFEFWESSKNQETSSSSNLILRPAGVPCGKIHDKSQFS